MPLNPLAQAALALVFAAAAAAAGPDAAPAAAGAAPRAQREPRAAAFGERLETLVGSGGRVPGAVAAFASRDGGVVTAAAGWADLETRTPMTSETRFLGASIGKTFVAALLVGLAQEGALRLDDPLERWLGEEPWFSRLPNARQLTLRMLLRHRSGIPDHVYQSGFLAAAAWRLASGRGHVPFAPRELVGFVLGRRALFAADGGYAYSDTNYILAGLVIERATGRPYEELLAERFLAPLGLTGTAPANRPRLPGLAAGYVEPLCWLPRVKTTREGALCLHPGTEWTGGGIVTSAGDLARWGLALYEGRALPEPYLDVLLAAPSRSSETASYGLGSFVYETRLGVAWGHGGWIPGYTGSLLYFPAHHLALAVLANGDCGVRENLVLDWALALAESLVGP